MPSTISTDPLTSSTEKPGYIYNPAGGTSSYAYWLDTAINALAYDWATATPEERNTFLSSTSQFGVAYGMPDPTDRVIGNKVYSSDQTILALTKYMEAGNYGPELLSLVGPPPAKTDLDYMESPEATANRIAQANADRDFQFAQDEAAQARVDAAASRALTAQQIAASKANAALAAQASMYGADKSLEGTKYAADSSRAASMFGTRGQFIGDIYGTNEGNRVNAYGQAGTLASTLQGLWDSRTDNLLSLRYDPSDLVAREFTSRALLQPEGYEGPAYRDVPQLQQAIDKLLNYNPSMTLEQALALLNQESTGGTGGIGGVGGTGGTGGGGDSGDGGATSSYEELRDRILEGKNTDVGSFGAGRIGPNVGTIVPGSFEFDMSNPYGQGNVGTGGVYDANTQSYTTGEIGPQPQFGDKLIYNPATGKNEYFPAGTSYSNPGSSLGMPIDKGPITKVIGGVSADEPAVDELDPNFPGAAFGGRNFNSAIVGDPQVPGMPNEELVIDRHPEPGFDVVPLNQLPGTIAQALSMQEPHYAWGAASDAQSYYDRLHNIQEPSNTGTISGALGSLGGQTPVQETQPIQPAPPATSTPATQPPPPAQVSAGSVLGSHPATGTGGTTGTPTTTPTHPTPVDPTTGAPIPSTTNPPSTQSPNGTVISYPDEVYQSMPTPNYLKGEIPFEQWAALNTGTVTDAFGEELPDIGGINLARAFQIMQDPEAWGALGSRYKSANRNLDAMIARALGRAPRTIEFTPYAGMVET